MVDSVVEIKKKMSRPIDIPSPHRPPTRISSQPSAPLQKTAHGKRDNRSLESSPSSTAFPSPSPRGAVSGTTLYLSETPSLSPAGGPKPENVPVSDETELFSLEPDCSVSSSLDIQAGDHFIKPSGRDDSSLSTSSASGLQPQTSSSHMSLDELPYCTTPSPSPIGRPGLQPQTPSSHKSWDELSYCTTPSPIGRPGLQPQTPSSHKSWDELSYCTTPSPIGRPDLQPQTPSSHKSWDEASYCTTPSPDDFFMEDFVNLDSCDTPGYRQAAPASVASRPDVVNQDERGSGVFEGLGLRADNVLRDPEHQGGQPRPACEEGCCKDAEVPSLEQDCLENATEDNSRLQYPQDSQQYPQNYQQYLLDTQQYSLDTQQYSLDTQQHLQDTQQYLLDTQQYPQDTQQYPQSSQQYALDIASDFCTKELLKDKVVQRCKEEQKSLPDLSQPTRPPQPCQLTPEEEQRNVRKRQGNKVSAKRAREKRKAEAEKYKEDVRGVETRHNDLQLKAKELTLLRDRALQLFVATRSPEARRLLEARLSAVRQEQDVAVPTKTQRLEADGVLHVF